MNDDKKENVAGEVVAAGTGNDDDAAVFAQLIADIQALKDDDTIVEHMDVAAYAKGRRQ